MIGSGRFHPLVGSVSALAVVASIAPIPAEARPWRFHADHVLETSLDVAVIATNEPAAFIAANAARAECERLDTILSGWRHDSEVTALNAARSKPVSIDLFRVLEACERWRQKTSGALSGRLGEIVRIWRDAADGTSIPVGAVLLRMADALANAPVELDATTRVVSRPQGVVFALDGLAKGYIVDAALEAARRSSPDAAGLMIDIGGDVRCWGRPSHANGWRVAIADPARPEDNAAPAAIMELTDKAIATSGRGRREHVIDGQSYSHLISPQTGWPVEHIVSATVLADCAADADALATAFSVMRPEESMMLADRLPGVEAMVVSDDGRRHVSRGWNDLISKEPQPQGALRSAAETPLIIAQGTVAPASAGWPSGFALDVQYEIPIIERGRYYRPYVVIWITDGNKQAVRTLLMLGRRPQYQDANYVWWRQYGRRASETVDAVSRPTRAPGRYLVSWDGTDDQGRHVDQGRYILHTEASREYGGHSYQAIEVDLGETALDHMLPAKDEIGTTKLTYGKRK